MGASERVHDHYHHYHHHIHRHPGLSFHCRQEHNDHHDQVKRSEIRKGCVTIIVGQGEEEERVLVPVSYMNHPLFVELLKEAEEEYGFDQKGPISIPCRVDQFKFVQDKIDKDQIIASPPPCFVLWCLIICTNHQCFLLGFWSFI